MTLPQFQLHFDPLADPNAIVAAPGARFTVLTNRLVRMEYSPVEEFEDHPSQVFWYRRQPLPAFETRQSPSHLEIETEELRLTYQITAQGFTPATLTALVKSTNQTWHYGDPFWRSDNLYGTARTLDEAAGSVRLEPGLVGRAGWAVVDDSHSLVFNESGWLESRRHVDNIDLYFFGYGHDYPGALGAFSLVAGEAPLVPRYILGNWWSRYWAYTQDELLDLMQQFQEHHVPLSVCIIDMDWHITDTGNRSSGWTGYTWNRALIPDPQGLIDHLHALGLRTALNLHPADGVYPHEEQYPLFAQWMGLDPALEQPIPFDCADPRFIQAYFDLLHHPLEAQGIDFWWLDWQQGASSRLAGMDPLWWLNHLHFYDLGRDGLKRPIIFSRWGGLGNHRYPIGFSGDTVVGWEALSNQPAFTATAANVGYGWWSHDIGGHMGGVEDDELYTRWVQYGVFSPILRLHSTNVRFHERRPWQRGPAAAQVASQAMRLRHSLIPYIYSMAWRHHTTSLPLVTPMYYSHPENPAAYEAPQQYWFGSELVAAPFTAPAHPETGLARQAVWFPPGEWFDFFNGEHLTGDCWRTIYGNLGDIPVYARAGAILPLAPEAGWGGVDNPEELDVLVFPGAENRIELVEDDGLTTGYRRGAYAVTTFIQEWQAEMMSFTIAPARGDLSAIPAKRSYRLLLRGFISPQRLHASINDQEISLAYTYDLPTETLRFSPLTLEPVDEFKLVMQMPASLANERRGRTQEKLSKYLHAFRLNTWIKQMIETEWPEIVAGRKSLRAFSELSDAQFAVLIELIH
jgi:alpha-glucosidase (family GH31 glycosyl hydrolase)